MDRFKHIRAFIHNIGKQSVCNQIVHCNDKAIANSYTTVSFSIG